MPPASQDTNAAVANMIQSFEQPGDPNNVFAQPGGAPAYTPPAPPYQPPAAPAPPVHPQPPTPQYQQPGGAPAQPGYPPQAAQPAAPGVPGQPGQGQPPAQPPQPQVPQTPPGPQPYYAMPNPAQLPQAPQSPQDPVQAAAAEIINAMQQQAGGQPGQGPQPGQNAEGWDNPAKRPRTWGEFQQALKDEMMQTIQGVVTQNQQQADEQKRQEAESMRQAQAQIDQAEVQLRQLGYLPQVANPMDPNDPGLLATRELEQYALYQGSSNLYAAATSLKALHDNGYYFDFNQKQLVRRGSRTAAANAPIAGASPSMSSVALPAPTQSQLAGMSLDQLMSQGMAATANL